MTTRLALFWFALVPITIAVWAKVVLPPCVFGCVRKQQLRLEPVVSLPVRTGDMVICPWSPPCWLNGRRCLDGALCRQLED